MTSSCRNRYRRLTTNENGRSKLTEAYFKNQFREEGIDVSKIKPTPMKQPFTQKKKHMRLSIEEQQEHMEVWKNSCCIIEKESVYRT